MPIRNPVLPGCYPDPSICRVGDHFYLVASSFSLHPGIPIHRSTNLVDWELIGHALNGDSWLDIDDLDLSDGVWAPTIRENGGTFYIVFSIARNRRGGTTYVCTARDPRGPWATTAVPAADGIDPSLFFDDDGRCWFTAARDTTDPGATGPAEIYLRQFDPVSLRLVGPTSVIWHGAVTGAWCEAPHIYKRDGIYTLIGAEGGTERNHAITAARATSIRGPYRTDPRSPLLTHRHLHPMTPVQNVGHADIVDAADGSSWAVLLAVRPIEGHIVLGRESFLTEVEWSPDGPVFASGAGRIELSSVEDERRIETGWVSLRGPIDATVRGDAVTIGAGGGPAASSGRPALLAQRQVAHACAFEATLDTDDVRSGRPALVAYQSHRRFAQVQLRREGAGVVAVATITADGRETEADRCAVSGEVRLAIHTSPTAYSLGIISGTGMRQLARVPHSALSTETAGGFLGVLLGLVNEGPADAGEIDFRHVEHRRATLDETLEV